MGKTNVDRHAIIDTLERAGTAMRSASRSLRKAGGQLATAHTDVLEEETDEQPRSSVARSRNDQVSEVTTPPGMSRRLLTAS
jgi:hypothetical protein